MRRPHYIVLACVVALTLVVLSLPRQTSARLKLALGSLFLPLFGLNHFTHNASEKIGETVVPRSELLRQNEVLRRDNEQYRLQQIQDQEIARENIRLRQMLGWLPQHPWRRKLARVVLRDPANWWHTVQIDLGSRDGISNNLPVLTSDGLVGRINAVSLTRSQVVLLGDPNCKVSAFIDNDTRDQGVIESSGPFDSSLLTLEYLPNTAAVKPGQPVLTSGLGDVFPKGIPIGRIVDSRPVEYGLYSEARVRITANLSALEEVWVLFP